MQITPKLIFIQAISQVKIFLAVLGGGRVGGLKIIFDDLGMSKEGV
jgi:hypothetical protein